MHVRLLVNKKILCPGLTCFFVLRLQKKEGAQEIRFTEDVWIDIRA